MRRLPPERALPLIFKAIEVTVERMLDLTDPAITPALGTTIREALIDQWWLSRAAGRESLSQAVGRAARTCGVQALISASSHASGHGLNVIVFPDQLSPPSRLRVLRGRRER